ncbi:hypothetical protein KC678_03440 [Candidatus Dojkabacteria bacterium]|uniref:VWFA domain-containing protein n=1 Tax=Candidatus Dojkabacteria bacterium TaxID=2099670 RepID=A0A955L1S6_9BACT|nr:hypothetical protein [Candidatus Dojkabacteria bacterium]
MKRINEESFSNLFGEKRYTINCDKFDIEDFQGIKECSSKLLKQEAAGAEELPTYPDLMQDMFSMLCKTVPKLNPEYEVKLDHMFNYEIAKQMQEHRRTKEIRAMSQMDKMMSALGVEDLSEETLRLIKELKEQRAAQKEMEDAAKALQDALGNMPVPGGNGDKAGDGDAADTTSEDGEGEGKAPSPEELTLEAAKQRMQDAVDNFKESFEDKEVKNKIGQALSKVRDGMRQTSKLLQQWGLGGDSSFINSGHRHKIELLKKLEGNSKLKQIAELAGKLTMLAMSEQAQKIPKGCEEVYSISTGRDFDRMLPSELLKLQDPDREIEFFKDYIEGNCLQYALKGKEKKARGAMVVCIDESGSMQGAPDNWAKAVAIALLNVAKKQNRNFFVVHFNGNRNPGTLPVHRFTKTEGFPAERVIDMAEMFMNGGTDFMAPLTRARMCIDEEVNFHKADIIFITDGECAVTNDWLAEFKTWKKSKAVSIYSILINCGYNSDVSLKEFSDKVAKLNDMRSKGDEIAIDLFASV